MNPTTVQKMLAFIMLTTTASMLHSSETLPYGLTQADVKTSKTIGGTVVALPAVHRIVAAEEEKTAQARTKGVTDLDAARKDHSDALRAEQAKTATAIAALESAQKNHADALRAEQAKTAAAIETLTKLKAIVTQMTHANTTHEAALATLRTTNAS